MEREKPSLCRDLAAVNVALTRLYERLAALRAEILRTEAALRRELEVAEIEVARRLELLNNHQRHLDAVLTQNVSRPVYDADMFRVNEKLAGLTLELKSQEGTRRGLSAGWSIILAVIAAVAAIVATVAVISTWGRF